MSRVISSTRPVAEQPADQGAAAVHLQLTTRLGLQLADGRREVTGRTVVSAQRGSVSVADATYLGASFNATPMGWARSSSIAPH
jgi:hypothetical protein